MQRSLWMRRVAAAAAIAMIAAACGGDDDPGTTPTTPPTTPTTPTETASDDGDGDDGTDGTPEGGNGILEFGYVLPETGQLAFLGPPQIQALALAIADINAAGGVLGNQLPDAVAGDEAGDAARASENAQQVLAAGVDAIIGAASSGMSLSFVDAVTGAGVLQCSGSNTAPTFTANNYGGLYSRTAPTDALQGPVLAELVLGDGNSAPAILARADDYGQGLLQAAEAALRSAGADIAHSATYDPEAQSFDAEVSAVVASGADSVILISFEEGGQILAELVEQGWGPGDVPIYGADGLAGDSLWEQVDPNNAAILVGMQGTRPASSASPEFLSRFQSETGLTDTTFAPQIYDCVTIIALAAEIAGSDVGSAIAAEMVNVTSSGGTECNDFASCKTAIDAGNDITYLAASGVVLTVTENGNIEPESGLYEIYSFNDQGGVVGGDTVEANF